MTIIKNTVIKSEIHIIYILNVETFHTWIIHTLFHSIIFTLHKSFHSFHSYSLSRYVYILIYTKCIHWIQIYDKLSCEVHSKESPQSDVKYGAGTIAAAAAQPDHLTNTCCIYSSNCPVTLRAIHTVCVHNKHYT